MEVLFSNVTVNSSKHEACELGPGYLVGRALIDILPQLLGQPVIMKLLLATFMSKKTIDILNFNLALFHNLQYLISILHLSVLFLYPIIQIKILKFLLVYAQIGGPMSLSFICMERYIAVIHPTSYPLLKTYRVREVCAVTVWLFSVPMAFANILDIETLTPYTEEAFKMIPVFVLPLMTVMMVRSSVSIARTLKKSGPGQGKLHPVKKRAFKTVLATSYITLFFYTPVTTLQRFMVFDADTYNCLVTPLCIFLLSVASVVHPMFYLHAQGKLFNFLEKAR